MLAGGIGIVTLNGTNLISLCNKCLTFFKSKIKPTFPSVSAMGTNTETKVKSCKDNVSKTAYVQQNYRREEISLENETQNSNNSVN